MDCRGLPVECGCIGCSTYSTVMMASHAALPVNSGMEKSSTPAIPSVRTIVVADNNSYQHNRSVLRITCGDNNLDCLHQHRIIMWQRAGIDCDG